MTWIFLSPAPVRTTSNSSLLLGGGGAAGRQRPSTMGAAAVTPNLSSMAFTSSAASSTVMLPMRSRTLGRLSLRLLISGLLARWTRTPSLSGFTGRRSRGGRAAVSRSRDRFRRRPSAWRRRRWRGTSAAATPLVTTARPRSRRIDAAHHHGQQLVAARHLRQGHHLVRREEPAVDKPPLIFSFSFSLANSTTIFAASTWLSIPNTSAVGPLR